MIDKAEEKYIYVFQLCQRSLKVFSAYPIIRIYETNEFTFGHSQTIIPCLTDTCILLMNHSDTRIAVCIFVAYITSSVLTSVVDKN